MESSPFIASADQRSAARRLVDRIGEMEAARRLGFSRSTLTRFLAALPVRRAVLIAAEVGLERIGPIESLPPKAPQGRPHKAPIKEAVAA